MRLQDILKTLNNPQVQLYLKIAENLRVLPVRTGKFCRGFLDFFWFDSECIGRAKLFMVCYFLSISGTFKEQTLLFDMKRGSLSSLFTFFSKSCFERGGYGAF